MNTTINDIQDPFIEEESNNTTNTTPQTTENEPTQVIPAKQESVTVFGEGKIPASIANNIKPVDYPPTKRTRFSLVDSALEAKLADQIKTVFPTAEVEFKPNKAEVADMTIWRDDTKQEKIGCVNFIHQDRQKEGSVESKKYMELMFFNFKNKEEYDRVRPAILSFFKDMDDGTTVDNTYTNIKNNANTAIMGGFRRRRGLKKTHKKKKATRGKSSKHKKLASKRRIR